MRAAVAEARPDAVVLLGHLDLERPLAEEMADLVSAGIRVMWVHGNHDAQADRWHDNLLRGGLEDGRLHGRVQGLGGLRLAGLGGIFMSRVWRPGGGAARPPWQGPEEWLAAHAYETRLPPLLRGAIWPADYDRVAALAADILVCHDAPSAHHKGHRALDELAAAMGARLIVHGHHHESYQADLGGGLRAVGVASRATWRLRDAAAWLSRRGSRPGCRPDRASA